MAYHISEHYNDVIMSAMASQTTGVSVVFSTVYSGADQRKQQNSASLAFVRGIHQWPVNSPHKGPVTRKMFPFDDVIMENSGGVTKAICPIPLFSPIFHHCQNTAWSPIEYSVSFIQFLSQSPQPANPTNLTTFGTRVLKSCFGYSFHSHIFEANCSIVFCIARHLCVMETFGYPVTHIEEKQTNPWRHTETNIIETRYIAIPYNTMPHTVHWIRKYNFGQTMISRKTPIPRPNGRAMGVSRELLQENRPRYIGSARYYIWSYYTLHTCRIQENGYLTSLRPVDAIWRHNSWSDDTEPLPEPLLTNHHREWYSTI